jgi:hypothetical protein
VVISRKISGFSEWLQDPYVREYARIDSIPPSRDGTSAPEDVYNTSCCEMGSKGRVIDGSRVLKWIPPPTGPANGTLREKTSALFL